MKIPTYFSTLNKGKITLYIKKEYEDKLPKHDINKFFNLYKNLNGSDSTYYGRTPCKILLLKSLNDENLVVRDYMHGGLFRMILGSYFWQRSRPLNELSICEAARKRGIRTTEIIAIVKNRIIGPLYKCKLVSKEITNAIDLMELLLHFDENHILTQKRQIVNKVARAIKGMHDAGIYHADLHLKNILIQQKDNNSFSVYIIDLDKSKQFKEISLDRRMKNLMRLDRSLEKFIRNNKKAFQGERSFSNYQKTYQAVGLVTKADKIRFLREYIKSGNESTVSARQSSSGGVEMKLKDYLKTYSTTHKPHRFWWLLSGSG